MYINRSMAPSILGNTVPHTQYPLLAVVIELGEWSPVSFPQANYYARFAGEVFPFYEYLNDLAKMTALTESKKFRSICKAVLHIRPLAVELQLSEPLTDITIESFIAHLAAVLFVQRGVDETIVMMDETYNRAQTDTPSDPVNLVGGAFDFQEGSDPSGTDDEMPFLIPDVD